MSGVFPLKAYRINPRKPTMKVDTGAVELYLPSYFGRRRWHLHAREVAVVDLETPGGGSTPSGAVFATPPLLPYLFTTGSHTMPTTALLFEHPQRVPPIRRVAAWAPNTDLPIGVFESRSKNGAHLDRVFLRFHEPALATQALIRAGATATADPDRWLAGRRRILSDPEEVRTAERRYRSLVWLDRSRYLFIALAVLVAMLAGSEDASWLEFSLIMTAVGASFAVPSLAQTLMKRDRRQSQM